jgi:phthiodiolone/phenolphthiodiolone dimycocerosates ketoreductase
MTVRTAVPIMIDRYLPAEAYGRVAEALQASGVVDQLQAWDQLTSWYPPSLWTPENSPMARVLPDLDSFPDVWAMTAYGAARAPELGIAISTDSIRKGPAEMAQSALTLANITKGNVSIQIGAGEIKQHAPFGWKRSQGLRRLEDQFKAFHALWNTQGPVDLSGHFTTFDQAWLGDAKNYRPRIWALGGGPKLIDIGSTYADGFATMAPFISPTPEHWAGMVTNMKQQLEAKGRDPEDFEFGVYGAVLLHEDPAVIDRALDNVLLRWVAAIFGRINQADWISEGHEPPFPPDWHYGLKLLTTKISESEIQAALAKVTRAMSEKTWLYGTPEKVAANLQAYVDAGATWVSVIDILPTVLDPEDAPRALPRTLEVCRVLKENAVASAPRAA